VLDRLYARLEAGTPTRFIDSKTREPVSDLSKPAENVTLDSGPEKKFSPYSYPMGVIYSGMQLAGEVTGDKKYAEFAAKRYQFFADNLPGVVAVAEGPDAAEPVPEHACSDVAGRVRRDGRVDDARGAE
jgi:hypothetical protein